MEHLRQACCHPQVSAALVGLLGEVPLTMSGIADRMCKRLADEVTAAEAAYARALNELGVHYFAAGDENQAENVLVKALRLEEGGMAASEKNLSVQELADVNIKMGNSKVGLACMPIFIRVPEFIFVLLYMQCFAGSSILHSGACNLARFSPNKTPAESCTPVFVPRSSSC
jgi:hypothetical protein